MLYVSTHWNHVEVDILVSLWITLSFHLRHVNPDSAGSSPSREENMQIFLSAQAVLLVAKAVWRTEFELSPGQAEPITRALTTCPTPTARLKIPVLGKKPEYPLAVITVISMAASQKLDTLNA